MSLEKRPCQRAARMEAPPPAAADIDPDARLLTAIGAVVQEFAHHRGNREWAVAALAPRIDELEAASRALVKG